MSKITAVVLAAGRGSRMKSDTPKQFLNVNGKPLLAYSLETFEKSEINEIILVTAEESIGLCSDIIKKKKI